MSDPTNPAPEAMTAEREAYLRQMVYGDDIDLLAALDAAREAVRIERAAHAETRAERDEARMARAEQAETAPVGLLEAAEVADNECERHEPGLRLLRRALESGSDSTLATRTRARLRAEALDEAAHDALGKWKFPHDVRVMDWLRARAEAERAK